MKKRYLIIGLLILLLSGCGYDEYEMPKDAYININDKTYEVYDMNAKLYDLISDNNVEVLSDNDSLDTTKLGKNKVTLSYKYKRRKYKYDINYNVVDTTKPIFLYAPENITIYNGDEINFCDNLNFADNYDNEVKCDVEGEFNNTVNGTYNLKYIITDINDNKNEKDLVVNVINQDYSNEEENDNSNNNYNYEEEYIDFKDIVKDYKNDNTMIGIDVSYWQQNVDYEKVKKAGCEFVIIRIGVNDDIDEDLSVDSFYLKNIQNAKKAGLKVGVYVYTTAIDEETAREHAKWVVKTLDKEKLDFPIAFDWENFKKFRSYKISMYDLTSSFLAFKDEVNKNGYDAMLYSSMNYLNNIWMFNDTYDVWLAHYTYNTTYQGKYVMWQMASDGKIDGIDGYVDIDIYYKE